MMEKNGKVQNAADLNTASQQNGTKNRFLYFVFGALIGIILIGVVGWQSMPGMMLTTHQSRYDTVDETCLQLKAAIEDNGWSCPAIRDMNLTIKKHGVTLERPVKIVELCNAEYARDVLTTNPEVSTLMPCAWGVYEGDDGNVYITGMNMGLMARMFGGNIARVMGGPVSEDEEQMLARVILESK